MIVENKEVKNSLKGLDKKHIFVVILALKQLCVHPMILLKSTFEELDELAPLEGGSSSGDEDEPRVQQREHNGAWNQGED